MDFHALPRRDLQALCKRNSIRANMTNAAMADALSELPAVDGIEEYVKPPAAEPTPVANPAVSTVADVEKRDLKRDEHKDTAPALGLGRCAQAEPLVAPATKRRAAVRKTEAGGVASEAVPVPAARRKATVSKTEPMATRRRRAAESQAEAGDVAKEAVPASTTSEGKQMEVALVAEAKVPRGRRTARKAPATKNDMEQEEEEEGTQGVVSDVKTAVPAAVSDEKEGRDEPGMEEAMNPENKEQNEVAEESAQEEEEIAGAPMEIATPVVEEPPLAEDCTDNSSVQERQVDVEQCEDLQIVLGLVEQQECAPFRDIAGIDEGPLDGEVIRHASEEKEIVPVKEEVQGTLESVQATEIVNAAGKANDAGTEHGVLLEEKEGQAVHEVLHDTNVVVEEEVVLATDKLPQSSATMNVDVEEVFTVKDLTQLTATDVEGAGEEMVFTGNLEENEAGVEDGFLLQEKEGLAIDEVLHDTDETVEDEGVVATDNMPQISATVNVDVDGAGEESAFTGDLEEIEAGAEDCTDNSSVQEQQVNVEHCEDLQIALGLVEQQGYGPFLDVAGIAEGPLEDELIHHASEEAEIVSVEEEVQGTLESIQATENVNEGGEVLHTAAEANEAGTEHGILIEEKEGTNVVVEEEVVLATDKLPQSSATMNVDVEEVFTFNDLTQLTDVEGAGEEMVFTGDLEQNEDGAEDGFLLQEKEGLAIDEVLHDTDETVEDEGVVATDNMPQISATVKVDVEEVFTVNDLTQLTATNVDGAGEESAFTGDLEENEAGAIDGFLLQEKEDMAVDEVLHDTDVAVEDEGVVATDNMPQISATVNVDAEEEVFTVHHLSRLVATDVDGAGEESAFTGDLEENEAGAEDGFLLQEKEDLAVDEVLHAADVEVEEEGVVSTDSIPQISETVNVDVEEEVSAVDHLSHLMERDVEVTVEESVFTGDLFCSVHNTSPFFAGMLDDITKSVPPMDSDTMEAKVPEEAVDVSPCMYNSSNKKNITESAVAMEPEKEKEVTKSKAMGDLSLRKLRLKFKETVSVGQENEMKEGKKKSMDFVTFEPYVSEEAGDASLCVYNDSSEKSITESVPVEQEEEVKQGNKSEATGDLSIRKLGLKMKEKVVVGQENEVKEGKKSMALDKLSLRKLKTKLRETLNAQKSREPNRAPLGRLDENVC